MKTLFNAGNTVNTKYIFKIEGGESAELSTPLNGLEDLKQEITIEGVYKAMQEHATDASSQELQSHLKTLRDAFPNDDLDTVENGITMNIDATGTKITFKKEAVQVAAVAPAAQPAPVKSVEVKRSLDYKALAKIEAGSINQKNGTFDELLYSHFEIKNASDRANIVAEMSGFDPTKVWTGDTFKFEQDRGNDTTVTHTRSGKRIAQYTVAQGSKGSNGGNLSMYE